MCVITCWQKDVSLKHNTLVGQMFSKVTRYGLAGILTCLALGSYLNFLAERDSKMLNYYDSTKQNVH